jgi:hypothetical protein
MSRPDDAAILNRISVAIMALGPFDNWHGIVKENLPQHLIEPYLVAVDYSGWRVPMWVVLHEHLVEPHGYSIAFCAESDEWCLIEKEGSGYRCDVKGDPCLADALSNM